MIPRALLLALLSLIPAAARDAESDLALKGAMVKIFTVCNEYDYFRPWQMKGKQSKTGSGCIIAGNRILTNAHVVADQTFLQVERYGLAQKFVAEVEYVGHECDLAILRVKDTTFFAGVAPVPIGELPQVRDNVGVFGFPSGGSRIAITEGTVSRIENLFYSHSQAYLLCCQIDAPINPGSSGGPVIAGGALVGVAFQAGSGENVGYMVPAPVVNHFLNDVKDGKFDGFPTLALSYQKLENPSMRQAFGMDEQTSGILVNTVFKTSPAYGLVRKGDIILAIDGQPVANDATVTLREGDRTFYEYPAQSRQMGESVALNILRGGKQRVVSVRLSVASNGWHTVPRQSYDVVPRYYIGGGLVFVPLTRNLLSSWGANWATQAPRELVYHYFREPDSTREEIVVLSQVLTDEVNVGFDDHAYSVIANVNGKDISRLEDVVGALEDNRGPYHRIVNAAGYEIVLPVASAQQQQETMRERYKIMADRSPGLTSGR
jgi:S1-C subfamily serine protease